LNRPVVTGDFEKEIRMIDNSLLQDFIIETGEHLEETERNLLRLEQQPEDAGVLNEIFRSIHTIKGSSEYLGLERVAELSHKLESLLDLVRRGERKLDGAVIDLLIGTNDRIGQLVDDLAKHQSERAQIDDLVSRIDALAGHVAPVSAEQVEADAMGDGESEAFEDEYDEELFGIFVDQLRDGLQALLDETGKLISGESADPALARYADRLGTLSSSANYMGYDKLKQIYAQWSQSVDEWVAGIATGQPRDWDRFAKEVTSANIERVRGFFSKVAAIQEMELEERLPISAAMTLEAEDQPKVEASDEPSSMLADSDDGLLGDFIEEAGEHLDEIEHNLLLLEKQPNSVEVLNELFRSVHTIKGSAEYLGMLRIAELSHKLESLLDLLRQEKIEAHRDIIDILMGGHDRIRQLVKEISDSQVEHSAIEDLVSRIDGFTEPKVSEPPAEELPETGEAGKIKAPARYEESYDKELFSIFMAQLKEGLTEIGQAAERLKASMDVEALLAQCKDRLARLRASANYMEYDDLKAIYDQWIKALDELLSDIEAGNPAEMNAWSESVMGGNLDRVRKLFDLPAESVILDAVEEIDTVAVEELPPETAPVVPTESITSEGRSELSDAPEVVAESEPSESAQLAARVS